MVFGLKAILSNIRLATLALKLFYLIVITFPILFYFLAFEPFFLLNVEESKIYFSYETS